jgi:hypothetical protein
MGNMEVYLEGKQCDNKLFCKRLLDVSDKRMDLSSQALIVHELNKYKIASAKSRPDLNSANIC